jgi:ArsR family transcriptional regulator
MIKEAKIFAVLSDPARLEILEYLSNKEGCVYELQTKTGRNQPNVSHHLRILRDAGLVEFKREGKNVCYFVSKPEVKKIIALAKKMSRE